MDDLRDDGTVERGGTGRGIMGWWYLIVGQLVPGLLPVGEDLPEHHPQAPHVTLCGELPVHDALWGHPADRQHGVTPHLNTHTHTHTKKNTGKSV